MEQPDEKIKELVLPLFKDENIRKYSFEIVFTQSGGSSSSGVLYKDDQTIPQSPSREVRTLIREFHSFAVNNSVNSFNKVEFTIYPDATYQAHYWWDDEEVRKNKSAWAKVLPQWVNDRLISSLFSAGYGDEKSWQRGVFTFTIQDGKLSFEGSIYKEQIPTTVDVKLPDYLIEGILEHHQITNEGELKDQWQPWNQMVIRSPHNDLNLDKDVTYSLNPAIN